MQKLLMSKTNPDGWKLEELLSVIKGELQEKNELIADDKCEVSLIVQENNKKIIALLDHSVMIQNETMRQLDTLGINQGALGKPRIGN